MAKLKYKKVVAPDPTNQYNPPVIIEWLSDNGVVQLERILPPSTHRKETIYEYKHVSPEFDILGRPSTLFGKPLTLRQQDIEKIEKQQYSRLYYDPIPNK
jgi:hypothetical protein